MLSLATLLPHEKQVLALCVAGYCNRDIARLLHTTVSAIKCEMNEVYAKTSIHDDRAIIAAVYKDPIAIAEMRALLAELKAGLD